MILLELSTGATQCWKAFLFLFLVLNHLLEQITKEEEDLQSSLEEILNLDTKIMEEAEEASQSKESAPLSLVDDVSEVIVQDSIPEDILADTIKIEEKDSEKAVVGING